MDAEQLYQTILLPQAGAFALYTVQDNHRQKYSTIVIYMQF